MIEEVIKKIKSKFFLHCLQLIKYFVEEELLCVD